MFEIQSKTPNHLLLFPLHHFTYGYGLYFRVAIYKKAKGKKNHGKW